MRIVAYRPCRNLPKKGRFLAHKEAHLRLVATCENLEQNVCESEGENECMKEDKCSLSQPLQLAQFVWTENCGHHLCFSIIYPFSNYICMLDKQVKIELNYCNPKKFRTEHFFVHFVHPLECTKLIRYEIFSPILSLFFKDTLLIIMQRAVKMKGGYRGSLQDRIPNNAQ